MKLFPQMNLLMQIHFHIDHKSTGTPKDFAKRLNMSERSLYRILEELKDKEIDIVYSRTRNSYVYMGENKITGLLKNNES